MKVKPNIGILNALIRITIGLTVLSWSSAKLVKRPYCNSYLWMSICSAMKVAEGIVRFCPVTAFIQKWQESAQSHEKDDHSESRQTFDETVPVNPS
ncbi:DUF2892 domain-containing protein [Bacillus sp. V3B]|nr:DUF2892 domain-containing protein [Bacillus sp. V3B]MCQ6277023.1 DUF2892 domain-containing protein [Bacillus sp. V3B]